MVSLAFFGHHGAHGKRVITVLPVIDVAKVDFILARKKELVRRRESRDRSRAGTKNLEPVTRANIDGLLVHRAPELVLLPRPRGIAPRERRMGGEIETF